MKLGGMCDTASGMGCSFQGCGKKSVWRCRREKRGKGLKLAKIFVYFFSEI